MSLANVKCVFIDWNGTLSYSLFWEHLVNASHDNHHMHGPIDKWLFKEHRQLLNPWMLGELSSKDVVTQMSSDLSLSFGDVMRELQESCENMVLCSTDIPVLINKIKNRGIKVVIATDNMDTFRQFTIPALNLDVLFDDILISSELHVLKDGLDKIDELPFFDSYLQVNKLTYSDVVLLDDSPDKTGKYNQLGFNRVLITSPNHLIEELEAIA
jgi:FMN phosphatase YigB (HAD superfamily)